MAFSCSNEMFLGRFPSFRQDHAGQENSRGKGCSVANPDPSEKCGVVSNPVKKC